MLDFGTEKKQCFDDYENGSLIMNDEKCGDCEHRYGVGLCIEKWILCSECQGRCIPCDIYPCGDVEAISNLPSAQPKKFSEVLQDMMNEDYYLFCHTGYSRLAEKDWEWLIEQVKEMEQKGRTDDCI